MAKYRLLEGKHSSGEKNPDGTDKVYRKGDVIETDQDLLKHNAPGRAGKKFEKVEE